MEVSSNTSSRLRVLSRHLTSAQSPASPPALRRKLKKTLIANRGEIAIRVAHAAAVLGIETVGVYHPVDAASLHTRAVSVAVELSGQTLQAGTPPLRSAALPSAAYLDAAQLVGVALAHGCDSVHPGYGFLSEDADFARQCEAAGLAFIGPPADAIELFGNKIHARALAVACGVPIVPGSGSGNTFASGDEVAAFVASDPAMGYPLILKAASGGGGRGMRVVRSPDRLNADFDACCREAAVAFGSASAAVFVERLVQQSRHVEVQILADSHGNIIHLADRDCSVQLRNQKVVEVAPAPSLPVRIRSAMCTDAVRLLTKAGYVSAGTVEFLVTGDGEEENAYSYYFIECNPRIQVEHTVTEQVTGVDLVEAQFHIAAGATLEEALGTTLRTATAVIPTIGSGKLSSLSTYGVVARGFAVQARVVLTGGGVITAYKEPSGGGTRVDSCGYRGYKASPFFDPLIAKVICTGSTYEAAVRRTTVALKEFHIEGVATNLPLLIAILQHPDFAHARTSFLEDHAEALAEALAEADRTGGGATVRFLEGKSGGGVGDVGGASDGGDGDGNVSDDGVGSGSGGNSPPPGSAFVEGRHEIAPPGHMWITSPLHGSIVDVVVTPGQVLRGGQDIAVVLSMKMEHLIQMTRTKSKSTAITAHAPSDDHGIAGRVARVVVNNGQIVQPGTAVALIELPPSSSSSSSWLDDVLSGDGAVASTLHGTHPPHTDPSGPADPSMMRDDLKEVFSRQNLALDAARLRHDPSFARRVARRRERGYRTARENIADLVGGEDGDFIEYGRLRVAGQRARRSLDDLIHTTPADGIITGVGCVNAEELFHGDR